MRLRHVAAPSHVVALALGGVLAAFAACSSPARTGSPDIEPPVGPPTVTGATSDDDAGSPPIPPPDAATDAGTGVHEDGAAPTPDGGADLSDAGPSTNGPDAFVDPPATPPTAGVCAPLGRIPVVHETLLTLATEDIALLGSVTPDGLTAAWSTSIGGATTFYVADRSSRAAPFGVPQPIANAASAAAFGRVALDASGTRLVVVAEGHRGFRELTRAGRGAPFDVAVEGSFVDLNAAIAAMPDTRLVFDPVLSQDGATFFYGVAGGLFEPRVFEATRDPNATNGGFAEGAAHSELASTPGARISPTGLSADGNALFVYDTGSGEQKGAFRASPTASSAPAPFTFVRSLGTLESATPSADCSQLFFAVKPASGAGAALVVATFAP